MATLSTARKLDRRLGNWKMKPTCRDRKPANPASESVHTSVPSTTTWPWLGFVNAPSMARSVDLPEPERPTIATSSPGVKSSAASLTAS
jgi:hypothetical protein